MACYGHHENDDLGREFVCIPAENRHETDVWWGLGVEALITLYHHQAGRASRQAEKSRNDKQLQPTDGRRTRHHISHEDGSFRN